VESAYAATLPPRERRLAGRLEGFGDIVFGFAVSQCALQLPTDHGHVDLARSASLGAYFGTFAVLASLWLSFHRITSESFRPTRVDLLLAFGYLAFVTLMPFAMFSITHERESLAAARAAVAEYAIILSVVLLLGATMTLRNLRRGWYLQSEEDRQFAWHAFVRRLALGVVVAITCAIDLVFGPVASSLGFVTLVVVPRLSRTLFRHPPAPASLRIAPP
jgi:uncharacterized membrane protein